MDQLYFQEHTLQRHDGSFWHFSKREMNDLILATLAFGLALAFMRMGGIFTILSSGDSLLSVIIGMLIWGILYILALGPAFIIHELAHKFLARHYGCWAEFRASPGGLRFGVFLAALTGILFMAPGAVMVVGHTTKQQFGKIALAGPLSNIMLWGIGIGLIALGLETTEFTFNFGGNQRGLLYLWCWANVGFGAFNMLPFGPLDGRKVKTWSNSVYWTWVTIFVSLVWFNLNVLPSMLLQ